MSDLAQFQQAFAEALLAQQPEGRVARAPGFAVYRNTCAHGVVEALRATYATVDCLLGDEGFTAAALAFRDRQPPASPVLSSYGTGFPGFLARQPWTSELPYLADVATLDWLWLDSHLAADRLPAAAAGTRRQSGLRLLLHPAARFAWLETPAVTIWLAHRCPAGFDDLEPEWRAEGALVTRRRGSVTLQPIRRAEHRVLSAIAAGAAPNDIAASITAAEPEIDVPSLFAGLLASGALLPA